MTTEKEKLFAKEYISTEYFNVDKILMEFDKKALRFFRENFGATQREVAEAVGVDTRTYQKWEKGDSVPDGHNLIRLMNFLNIETFQDFIETTPIIDNEFKLFRTRKSNFLLFFKFLKT